MSQIFPIFLISTGIILVGLWMWSGFWIYGDAERRGKPPMLVCVLALLISWPLSLLIWIALRPPIKRRSFDLEDFRAN